MLVLLSTLAPFFPLIAGFRQRSSIIWWYCLFSLTTDLLTYYLRQQEIQLSLPGNIFAGIEFLCLLFFYKNKVFLRRNTLFYIILASGILFFLTTTSLGPGWFTLNRMGITMFLLLYIVLALTGFYMLLREQNSRSAERSSFFWVNTAVLLFASGAFFMFLYTANIKSAADKKALSQLWFTLFQVINILKNILLGIALIQKQER
ncbi:hypothetical protein [Taibaiella chishuiensis]|uniref:YhhN-like protein n=1 Tax=Taibaiella chishuiensis TaxID=1434707 RepID=A0A2P8D4K4_9BACT|nr:hypothetical protein [Taibaiella chishuiensis]PSK92156.1 hypothetical protein B0I18_104254 [Taibaiella chishuiensis]